MRNILAIFIMCVALANQAIGDGSKNDNTPNPWVAADKKLSEFLPRLKALGEKHPDDEEIQLGLAFFYSSPSVSSGYSLEGQIEKVFMANADNRAAWALKAKLFGRQYTGNRRFLIDQLQRVIKYAKRNDIELEIPRYSQLYPLLKELGTDDTLVISDFDAALKLLQEKLDSEMPSVLAMLKKGEQNDSENALYNYLKAHIYFELGEENKAIQEIKNAVMKKHINNYVIEEHKAKARVLQEVGFPEDQRPFIVKRISLFTDFMRAEVWEKGLVAIAENYEAQGAFENADKIYKLTLQIAKQIREEPLPYPVPDNEVLSQKLESWSKQHNNNEPSLESRGEDKKMLGKSRSSVGTYVFITASCGTLIAGIILFLKKKTANSSK